MTWLNLCNNFIYIINILYEILIRFSYVFAVNYVVFIFLNFQNDIYFSWIFWAFNMFSDFMINQLEVSFSNGGYFSGFQQNWSVYVLLWH